MAFDNLTACRYFLSVSETNRLSSVRFGADGLVPVVTQESRSGDSRSVASANRDSARLHSLHRPGSLLQQTPWLWERIRGASIWM
jgi:hypothetical protein